MSERLSEGELSRRAGLPLPRVHELVGLGLLQQQDDGSFARHEVMRARVIGQLEEKGIDAEALATALSRGELSLGYLESAGRTHPRSELTFEQLAAEMAIPTDTLLRIFVAFGLPSPDPDETVRQEDADAVRAIPLLFSVGIDEGEVLRLARVWGEGIRKIAQFQTHYFHSTIEEPFRRLGLGDNEAFEAALREVGLRSGRSGEELLTWLFRRHADTSGVEHQFQHVETALERAGVREAPPVADEAVVFADLTGYTRLTEEAGDEVGASVALRLAALVSETAHEHRGQVIKLLGDGVHFHFRDPADAVAASLALTRQVREHQLPPAHIGVNAGPMIYDEGDYFGRTVNVAARIAAIAGPDQVFATAHVGALVGERMFTFVEAGRFELKGIAEPVSVYEVTESATTAP